LVEGFVGLLGQRVLVTGGTEGIGRAVVDACVQSGASVWVMARNAERLEERIAEWNEARSDADTEVHGIAMDVQELIERSGRVRLRNFLPTDGLDVVVSNVGTNIRKPATAYEDHEVDHVLSTNLRAAFALAQTVQPLLLAGTRARGAAHASSKASSSLAEPNTPPATSALVFVLSVAAHTHIPTGAPYAMSKAALAQLVRNLSVEWAPHIRVNAVSPWYTATPLVEGVLADPTYLERVLAATPLARIAEPAEVAAPILFLASKLASYITGQVLPVDGGFLARGF
jgi:tropinone reductase I